ncbi:hypothetical protein [Paludisphaera borealis]|uniref:Uncharacterized protein n=1 Tax=Paludisphaera borealis TaxID=1387353 RepID=A0A1U7CKS7_9BACT|nr:hypothetical protein [Paludisphaera borealis]APW59517.1 hypothetical protein BSF38_00941 [Paludisphaera borealis]
MSILNDLPTIESLRDDQRALRADLSRLRRRLRIQLMLELIAEAAVALAATGALLVLLDWQLRLSRPVRLVLLGLSLAVIAGFLAVRAVRRWRSSRLDELSLAVTLDRFRPGLGQQVADVLQLPDLLDEPRSAVSPAMVRLAVRQATEALARSDWRSLWNRRRTALHAVALLVGAAVPTVFAVAAPAAARLSFARWILGSNERWPQQTYLTVMGLDARGRLLAPRDERILMEVRTDLPLTESRGDRWSVGGRGEPLILRRKPDHPRQPREVALRERTAKNAIRSGMMVETDPVRFRYEFPPSSSSSSFELTGGDDWLGPITVDRVDRPALAATKLRVKEPGTADPEFRAIDDAGQHLLFLPDSEIELTLVGTEALSEAQMKIHPGAAPELKRIDDRSFVASWTLREAVTLEILLTSADTGLASKTSFLSIGLLRDREPRVTLRASGVGGHVTPIATIPLTIAATDDFGLAVLRIQADRSVLVEEKDKPEQKVVRSTINLPFEVDPAHPTLDLQVRHDLSLQSDPPKVGAVLRFTGEADDRCARGVQTGRSSVLALSVVSADELFYEILIRQRAERTKFMSVLEAAEKNTPTLEGSPTAEDLVRVMRTEQSGARQLEQITGRVADTLQEMKLNQIGSPKSHRLLQEGVVEPLRALTTGPMAQLRGMLQTLAGAAAAPGASKDAARLLHAEVVTKMKNILEQMSQWESFVDVVNQVAEVIKMEQKVLQETEKARETRTQEVFDDKP